MSIGLDDGSRVGVTALGVALPHLTKASQGQDHTNDHHDNGSHHGDVPEPIVGGFMACDGTGTPCHQFLTIDDDHRLGQLILPRSDDQVTLPTGRRLNIPLVRLSTHRITSLSTRAIRSRQRSPEWIPGKGPAAQPPPTPSMTSDPTDRFTVIRLEHQENNLVRSNSQVS